MALRAHPTRAPAGVFALSSHLIGKSIAYPAMQRGEVPRVAPPPTKILAVHINYRSRAEERGRTPAQPSYFFKPPSSLGADGDPVARPRGCELLNYEGEVAAIIGTRARNVTPEEGLAAIGWYAPANDFGVYDMRWADRGSNVMAKGQDGFTPLGPPAPAASV